MCKNNPNTIRNSKSRLEPLALVVLTDLGAEVEHLASSREAVIYRLLLLSLLYDEVLIPDEVPALSRQLSVWFREGQGLRTASTVSRRLRRNHRRNGTGLEIGSFQSGSSVSLRGERRRNEPDA